MTPYPGSRSKTKNVNNFQDLYERENNFENNKQKIKGDIWKTLGVFKFVGQIVDAYVPKLVDLFIIASGGRASEEDRYKPDSDPGTDPNTKGQRDPRHWTNEKFDKRA